MKIRKTSDLEFPIRLFDLGGAEDDKGDFRRNAQANRSADRAEAAVIY